MQRVGRGTAGEDVAGGTEVRGDFWVGEEGGGDGCECDEEGGAEVGAEAGDEPGYGGEGNGLFDVEVEARELVGGDEGVEGRVVGLELGVGQMLEGWWEVCLLGTYVLFRAAQALVATLCGATEHAQDLDAAALEPFYLAPQLGVAAVVWFVVVQRNVSWTIVQVDSCHYDMSDACVVGQERQK